MYPGLYAIQTPVGVKAGQGFVTDLGYAEIMTPVGPMQGPITGPATVVTPYGPMVIAPPMYGAPGADAHRLERERKEAEERRERAAEERRASERRAAAERRAAERAAEEAAREEERREREAEEDRRVARRRAAERAADERRAAERAAEEKAHRERLAADAKAATDRRTAYSSPSAEDVSSMGGAGSTVVSKLPDAFKIKWSDLKLVKNKDNRLGRGGFGVVYKGQYLTEPVAIKLVDFGDSELSAESLAMFWKEVQLHYSIRHANVVTVIGASIHTNAEGDTDYAVVLELMKCSLRGWIQQPGAVPMKQKLNILKQLANGLAFLHARGIVHRDLKPDNALIDATGNAKLSDFGLSYIRKTSQSTGSTNKGVAGTYGYIDPAIFSGEIKSLTKASDVYSFAIMAWEVLAKKQAFIDLDVPPATYHLHQPDEGQFPRETPPAVRDIIVRSWSPSPADRPTMAEIQATLDAC